MKQLRKMFDETEGLLDEVAVCEVAVIRRIVCWTVCNVKTKLWFTETVLIQ